MFDEQDMMSEVMVDEQDMMNEVMVDAFLHLEE